MSPPISGSKTTPRNQHEAGRKLSSAVPPILRLTLYGAHGFIPQKIELFISTAFRTSNPAYDLLGCKVVYFGRSPMTYGRKVSPPSSGSKTKNEQGTNKKQMVSRSYKTTRRYNPEVSVLYSHRCEILNCDLLISSVLLAFK
jgi:hypothetical protein